MLTFPSAPPPHHVRRPPQGLSELRKSPFFFGRQDSTQLTDFSQISAHASGAWRHSHPPIWDFYCDISEWHILPARAWTPALMLHRTNPCAKRKFLGLTKPKSKIYKTKSFGHYITRIWTWEIFSTREKKYPQILRVIKMKEMLGKILMKRFWKKTIQSLKRSLHSKKLHRKVYMWVGLIKEMLRLIFDNS